MMYAKFGTIVTANNDLARGGGRTYETPYTTSLVFWLTIRDQFEPRPPQTEKNKPNKNNQMFNQHITFEKYDSLFINILKKLSQNDYSISVQRGKNTLRTTYLELLASKKAENKNTSIRADFTGSFFFKRLTPSNYVLRIPKEIITVYGNVQISD